MSSTLFIPSRARVNTTLKWFEVKATGHRLRRVISTRLRDQWSDRFAVPDRSSQDSLLICMSSSLFLLVQHCCYSNSSSVSRKSFKKWQPQKFINNSICLEMISKGIETSRSLTSEELWMPSLLNILLNRCSSR